jgi:cob(I)alamin adenosyltransferase
MKIYTKTGDDGSTSLNSGNRVPKSNIRVHVYGTIDELNSIIGIISTLKLNEKLKDDLLKLSNLLFVLGTDFATPPETKSGRVVQRITSDDVFWLESRIDEYTEVMPRLRNFILPGGTIEAAYLHNARTVCRRAEREAVELFQNENINEYSIIFLNRLSDYLFTAARYANHIAGIQDIIWKGEHKK